MPHSDEVMTIKNWFREQGYTLIGPHRVENGDGFAAPFIRTGRKGGAAPYGWGDTELDAVLDAKAQLQKTLSS